MLRIYECIAYEHDLRLVALAALVCLIGARASIDLLHHVATSAGRARHGWLGAAAVATGSTVWSTHFIAMLAFLPGGGVGYEAAPTALSWAVAVGMSGLGLAVALRPEDTTAWLVGGGCVGLGVAAMHYLGMSGLRLQGAVDWDLPLVTLSVLVAALFGATALRLAAGGRGFWRHTGAVLCLTMGICGLHFLGMSAVTLTLDPTVVVQPGTLASTTMAGIVASLCVGLLALCVAGLVVDRRARSRTATAVEHMRDLADAAIEGLIVCDGEVVVAANRSFAAMIDGTPEVVVGMRLDQLLPDRSAIQHIAIEGHEAVETEVASMSGVRFRVELVSRPISFAGRPHRAIALRDLRDRMRADARIRFLAHHDVLTGLPNRASFDARLRENLADQREARRAVALLAIDLDRFKEVNDTLGHPIGDDLLRLVADRLRSALREEDCAARLGGDEFAVLQVAADQPRAATALAERLIDLLARPYVIQGHLVNVGVSIGIAMAPSDATEPGHLATCADLALYRAKGDGRGAFRFFEPGMDTQLRERRALEVDLRRAVARCEFEIHYQPRLGLRQDRVVGVEALLRWRHPERGLISPADFIPLAEETGLIVAIGGWVLRTACAEAAAWHHDVSLAVNLSPAQFRDPKLFDTILNAVERTALDPRRLELEITESVLLQDSAGSLAVLHRLRGLGIRISMDDFGTGYSSLSYLRSFPFDKIKIDRSFVGDMTSNGECAAIVRTIVALGRSMGISTTAEGVETVAQLEQMRAEGCDEVQGYLVGRPVPARDLRPLLDEPRRAA